MTAPRDAARAAAADIRTRQQLLTNDAATASAGTDPAFAPERERFGAYTHREIWDLVHETLDPAALGEVAAGWESNAVALAEAFQIFSDTANREFARWSGRSADAALQATRAFVQVGTEAHEVCRTVQRLMELNCEAAQTIRAAIPPPKEYRPLEDPAAEAVHGGQRRMEHDIAAATTQADVQGTMTYVYTPTMPASGDRVPRFTLPPEVPAGSAEGTPARPTSVGGGAAQ
ncbi:hypothetical protein [Nocardia sp. NBC_01009]|uniref:hypothetical protein n=1 Tax=Nocardia sp. NBC_01009 TaxID=2975996 RepID=UPI00386CAE3C|nr:hypothetical protein OHA42_01085 [Nocardia sp. NBC_01009]